MDRKGMTYNQVKADSCNSKDIFGLHIKALYLLKLYRLSLQYFNSIKDFSDIAALAIL